MLVLQWTGSTMADHAALIEFEKALESSLTGGSNVDGHDIGSDEMNIFVETDDAVRTFTEVEAAIRMSSLRTDMRAAYREIEGDDYTVVWPPGLSAFRVT
jgi:hypothetical protein